MVAQNLFKSPENSNNKSKLIKFSIIFTLAFVILAMTVGLLFLNIQKQTSDQTVNTSSTIKKEADDLKKQAISAENNNNNEKALNLYKQAKAKYQEINDTNGVVDTSAKIYMIENE